MLENTLCHIPRVSLNKEKSLWEMGIHTWESYQEIAKNPSFIDDCILHLKHKNLNFFAENLKSDQHWRFFADFKDSVAYIDIETTGLDKYSAQITTIALYDGETVQTYVQGKNLSDFKTDIQKYNLIVTFNGKTFDVPFINHYFNNGLY